MKQITPIIDLTRNATSKAVPRARQSTTGSGRTGGRSSLALFIAIAFFALVRIPSAFGAQTNLPTIFVAPIVGGPSLPSWRQSIGEAIADALINQLSSSKKFGVLETTALEDIRKEIKMGEDGWMEPSDKTEKGHWFGADYMLAGKLTHFDRPSNSPGGVIQGIPGLFGKKAKVQITWRVVNTMTRKVVASGTADSSHAREKFSFMKMTKGILGGEDGGEAVERALDLVLGEIINEVERLDLVRTGRGGSIAPTSAPAPAAPARVTGVVEAVKPDFVIVALGTKHGCKQGEKLELCETSDVRNAEGATVFKDEKVVGEVELEMCVEERSKGRYSSLLPPKEGWIVRRKAPAL